MRFACARQYCLDGSIQNLITVCRYFNVKLLHNCQRHVRPTLSISPFHLPSLPLPPPPPPLTTEHPVTSTVAYIESTVDSELENVT